MQQINDKDQSESSQQTSESQSQQNTQIDEEESKEQNIQYINQNNEFYVGDQIDCLDTVNKWLNAEIVAIRLNEIRVHYTSWSQKYDEWIPMNSPRILKQWRKGQIIQIHNRIDSYHQVGQWLESIVIDIDKNYNPDSWQKRVYVHYEGYKSQYDEWKLLDSNQVAEIGTYSSAYGIGAMANRQDDQNKKFQLLKEQYILKEIQFHQELKAKGMEIKIMESDGNCLFRSVSDQIYGIQLFHKAIRKICLDYIELEKDFFVNYIIGGEKRFNDYINYKRQDGIWGDDIELQALSEIYNRPIELYAYSSQPMRTFHEVNPGQKAPLRLSYHGMSHYNSIKEIGQQPNNDNKFGLLEQIAITRAKQHAKEKQQQKQEQIQQQLNQSNQQQQQVQQMQQEQIQKQIENDIVDMSRKEFEQIGKRDMELALEESLQQFKERVENIQEQEMNKVIQNSLNQYLQQEDEKQLVDLAIKESEQINKQKEEESLKFVIEQSKKDSNLNDPMSNPTIAAVVNAGVSIDVAIQYYTLFGDDPDAILNQIYEQ